MCCLLCALISMMNILRVPTYKDQAVKFTTLLAALHLCPNTLHLIASCLPDAFHVRHMLHSKLMPVQNSTMRLCRSTQPSASWHHIELMAFCQTGCCACRSGMNSNTEANGYMRWFQHVANLLQCHLTMWMRLAYKRQWMSCCLVHYARMQMHTASEVSAMTAFIMLDACSLSSCA